LARDALHTNARDRDLELVRRVRRGDDDAFGQIVDTHGPRLYVLALSMLGNREDAQDTVQETFIGAFRGLQRFKARASVKTWLTRILMNNAINCRRRRKIRKTLPLEGEYEHPGGSLKDTRTQTGRDQVRMDFAEVLTLLPEEQQQVVLLREVQSMTYDEIAQTLDIPRGTVESRLFRARQKLKDLLGDYLT